MKIDTIFGNTYVIGDEAENLFGGDRELLQAAIEANAALLRFRNRLFVKAFHEKDEAVLAELIDCIKAIGYEQDFKDFLDCIAHNDND